MGEGTMVFLCWSGTRSHQVAKALGGAIKELPGGLEGKFSPDITKGSVWFDEVMHGLEGAQAAIVCLTPENVGNPWMHFEAGAIAARMAAGATGRGGARVYPYLFQMNGVGLAGPLAQFQGTNATKEDTLRLVRALLPDSAWGQWEAQADGWWAELEQGLHAAEDRPVAEIFSDVEPLFRRKTFDEPLDECMNQAWAARWAGARDTHKQLEGRMRALAQQGRPYVREILGQLTEAVDGYAMALELLLAPLSFELNSNGKRDIPPGLLVPCEQRRRRVKELVSSLADPRRAPVFEDAPRFQAMESFTDKKTLVHQFEAWLARSEEDKRKDWRLAAAASSEEGRTSRWDFDRVAFYLCKEREPPPFKKMVDWLRIEMEQTRADSEGSHMPLTYCLGPLRKAIEANQADLNVSDVTRVRALLQDVCMLGKRRERQCDYPEPSRLRVEAEETLRALDEALDKTIETRPTVSTGVRPEVE
ncbi:MAG: TIR domain-containing protein [Betaproteobacteria bacterium]|nr:MAG: TIR domain-containing protein [Betaproteobacteria bacterium]